MNLDFKINTCYYKNTCRICLKTSENIKDLFTLIIPKDNTAAVDFIRKMTDLKILYSETLPSNICSSCTQDVFEAFDFVELCIASEARLRTLETRRMLRKIEAEALELEEEEEIILKCDTPAGLDTLSETEELPDRRNINNDIIVEKENPLPKELQFTVARTKNKYKCEQCGDSRFNNKAKFIAHQKIHQENPYKCTECHLSFNRKSVLNIHLRSHLNEDEKFSCKTCGKGFIYEYLLKQHEFKHEEIKPFPCTKCDKGCLTAESLRRHMRTHNEDYVKKIHICHLCNKSFAYPSFLAEHMKNHTGEKPFVCNICGKGFRQSGALHFHQRIHTGYKPFPCRVCKENFMARSILKVHMRKHTNERPYVCDICGISFRQSSDMKSHKRTHTGEKLVLCTVCGKTLSTTGQLTVHLRSHTGEKPYTCPVCNKSFAAKTMLVTHERVHNGKRPYVCTICNRGFSQSCTLVAHTKTHNKSNMQETKHNKKDPKHGCNKANSGGRGSLMKKIADLQKKAMMMEQTQSEEFVVEGMVDTDGNGVKFKERPEYDLVLPLDDGDGLHNIQIET